MLKHQAGASKGGGGASSDSSASLRAAIHNAKLVSQRAVHTCNLSVALKASEGTCAERTQKVAALLKEDAVRPEPLIDLSFTVEGDKSCVMFRLLHFFSSCEPVNSDGYSTRSDKYNAQQAVHKVILALQQKMLRSFNPSIADAATGNNALHELVGLVWPASPHCWSYEIIQLLIARGVSVHARNKAGRTPLVLQASVLNSTSHSAFGMRLLLSHGADLNAQDANGDGALHHLVKRKALTVLQELLDNDDVSHLDLQLINSEGHTPVDCAAIQLAQEPTAASAQQLHGLFMTHMALWRKDARPVLELCLQPVPIPDLAAMVMGYIDGSGAPFPVAANNCAEDSGPSAAAAPAQ